MNSSKQLKKLENIGPDFNDIFELNDEESHVFHKSIINSRLVEVVKELMKLNNVKTRRELADKIGKSSVYVTKLFRGEKYFNVEFLSLIEEAFNTSFQFTTDSIEKQKIYKHSIELMERISDMKKIKFILKENESKKINEKPELISSVAIKGIRNQNYVFGKSQSKVTMETSKKLDYKKMY